MDSNHRTSRAVTVLTAALLYCLLTAVAACAAPGRAGADGPDPSPGGGSPRYGHAELDAAATRIDDYLRRDYPGHYAGVVLDTAAPAVVVYRRASAELDAALRGRFTGVPLRLRDAPHSARELNALAERVRGDADHWRRQGITITSVAARPDGTAVEVGTREVAKATVELPERYGRAPLRVFGENPTLLTPSG
ncbi:hypothetical protein FHS43_001598 [Streptosporangium becharense]|uniref:Uncharacterized protein n=1 Tax=Streptosporangium becharense TaxID=1816182 RepID=A0A7W9MJZ5_9ACTN|nr:hypothetical protein [Streptosporangium becharense]MBB2910335.1 hypothetical protein [Streptosporangium becharense]MBB5823078.1 hypothetical protein [Streptosporangium becharense]